MGPVQARLVNVSPNLMLNTFAALPTGRCCCFVCSDDVGSNYTTLYTSMKDAYLKLLSLGLRALVYNGDTDMACNFLGDQWFVEDLGIEVWPLCLEMVSSQGT